MIFLSDYRSKHICGLSRKSSISCWKKNQNRNSNHFGTNKELQLASCKLATEYKSRFRLVLSCALAKSIDEKEKNSITEIPNLRNENVGVLLLNLGGPETLDDVEPFLYNLFADPVSVDDKLSACLKLLIDCYMTNIINAGHH